MLHDDKGPVMAWFGAAARFRAWSDEKRARQNLRQASKHMRGLFLVAYRKTREQILTAEVSTSRPGG
jgi:hypothetical protein